MDYLIIVLTAFATAILTFFSGFGMSTILTPVFALFFPVGQAIALTSVVHLANNIFKVFLVGKNAQIKVFLTFGIPGMLMAFAGAWLLIQIIDLPAWKQYTLGDSVHEITPVKITISLLLIYFALMDLFPFFSRINITEKWLPIGGALSGFFGGLSGHQGALRSAFLIKAGLGKEAFIGTSVLIGTAIDLSRLSVYYTRFKTSDIADNLPLVTAAIMAAITGAVVGNRLLKKITINTLQRLIAFGLIAISLALGSGLI
ncbi:TSUP family transporter [bacterium]|nr:TSUP family transporter [bacterium]